MPKHTKTPKPTRTAYGADTTRLARASAILFVSVPQLIAQARQLDGASFAATWKAWTDADALEAAGVFSEVLPAGSLRAGDEERALAGLAQALAALAFVPGGVTFGNRTYEAHPDGEAAA